MFRKAMRSISLMMLVCSVAGAATLHWTGAGGDNLWDNPANWESGQVPTAGDEAFIDVPAALAPNGPVIAEGMEAAVSGMACEVAGDPVMTMTGGTLDVASWIWWGDGANCHGTFYMSGGTLTTGSEFELGWGGGEGTWHMTGGTINAQELVIPTSSGSAGQLYLHGGIFNVGDGGLSMTEVGLLDITEGILTLEGDLRETVQDFIDDGLITTYASAGSFEMDYDLSSAGLTTVAAVAPVTEKAYRPVAPTDGQADVCHDTALVWIPGIYAAKHDVYLGTVFEDVNNASRANPLDVLVGQNVDANTYDPAGHLELGQTYYWRIDEVNGAPDFAIYKGDVWSFTTEAFAYPIESVIATSNATSKADEGPENTINGSGLNAADEHSTRAADMWLGSAAGDDPVWIQYEFDRVYQLHEMVVWNYNVEFELILGFGFRGATIEYSTDGDTWAALGDVELAQGTATSGYASNATVDFAGAAARFVKLTVTSGWGALPQYGLSEVRFLQVPAHARAPQPASGAVAVNPSATLSWRAGREAATHEVYFSDDPQAVASGAALVDTTDMARYDLAPLDLQLGQTYYWKINEVNEAQTPTVWEGNLWDFSTGDYLVVDDFERYTDDEDSRIYQSWIDGLDVAGNGSQVGYDSGPFAERTIVHGDKQSMPLAYENTGGATYSEAERTLGPAQDWTQAGVGTLTLFFHGAEDNAAGQIYVKINGTKVVYDGDAENVAAESWTPWNIDLPSTGANLGNVTTLSVGIEGSGSGLLFIDDIRLYRIAPEPAGDQM
jgi:F5/8 type C domain